MQAAGFNGFLIGETFMRNESPAKALADFIAEYNKL
jgi:indole-3-glycerol phosphate synthase